MTLSVVHAPSREAPPIEQIVHGPITFVAHCERDGLPFFGQAHVGYVPSGMRIGPSTLQRMVRGAARHGEAALERELAAMLRVAVRPAGVAAVIRTTHDCAGPRLLDDPDPRATTAWHGRYRSSRALRAEFLARIDPQAWRS